MTTTRCISLGLFSFALCAALGCNPAAPPPASSPAVSAAPAQPQPADATATTPPPTAADARALLVRMADAYRRATAYNDRGELTLTVRGGDGDGEEKQTFPLAVVYARPNKIDLRAYQAVVSCDGKHLRAKLLNPANRNFDGQVVEHSAPPQFTVNALAALGDILQLETTQSVGGPPPPLALLTRDKALDEVLRSARHFALLPLQEIEGRLCRGVQLEDEAGRSVWWIDADTLELRRFEYPTSALVQQFNVQPGQLTLAAEFREAKLNGLIGDERFALAMPKNPRIVKYLVEPPPLAPSELLGKPLPEVEFLGKDGVRITKQKSGGKPTVLFFWTPRDPLSVQALDEVSRILKDSGQLPDKATLIAVSTENVKIGDKSPYEGRQPDRKQLEALRVERLPMALVLDAGGTVQDVIPGFHAATYAELPKRLTALAAGQSLHEASAARFAAERQAYERLVKLAENGGAMPKSPPARHTMTSAWTCRDVKSPGNLLLLADSPSRLVVVEEFRGLAEVSLEGKLLKRHDVKLPDGAMFSFVRAARTRQGQWRYAVTGPVQRQVTLLDEKFQPLWRYPEGEQTVIADVAFDDLDSDGEPEVLIGYTATHGVHSVGLDGKRKWRNPSVDAVARLAVYRAAADAAAVLLCTTAPPAGHVTPIDGVGRDAAKWQPDAGPLVQLQIASAPGGRRLLCGVSIAPTGAAIVNGVGLDGRALWEYPLPLGRSNKPLEPIVGGRLVPGVDWTWVIGAPDGSLHLLDIQGKPLDEFCYGQPLGGLAIATLADGQPALIVATDEGLEALRFGAAGAK